MAHPSVSVLLAAHNSSAFIREAVESVLEQTHEDFELIAVDDGSTDETGEILESYRDPRIKVIRQENRGVSGARNRGLDEASAPIVTFLDGDDYWPKDRLERDVLLMESEPDLGVVFGNFLRFDEHGTYPDDQFTFYPELRETPTRVGAGGTGFVIDAPGFETVASWGEIPTVHSAITYRTDWVGSRRFEPQQRSAEGQLEFVEDLHFFLQMARGASIGFHPEPAAMIRRHDQNASSDWRAIQIANLASLLRLLELELTDTEQAILRSRIARQHIRVALYHAGIRRPAQALGQLLTAARKGRPLHAARTLARISLDSLRGREQNQ